MLNSTTLVEIFPGGWISCQGSNAPKSRVGGGSGGSVVIVANNFTSRGFISVHGGNTSFDRSGAGGGGRIAIQVCFLCL